jgi:hypothetical protein
MSKEIACVSMTMAKVFIYKKQTVEYFDHRNDEAEFIIACIDNRFGVQMCTNGGNE